MRSMSIVCRAAAVLAAGALVLTAAGTAQAAPADSSADWLAKQLVKGLAYHPDSKFPQTPTHTDRQGTLSMVYALDAIGGHEATLREIRDAVEPLVDDWTNGEGGGDDQVSAGTFALSVLIPQMTGADPRDFGGVDLVQRLDQQVNPDEGPLKGRVQDKGDDQDEDINDQIEAVRALSVAGAAQAQKARGYLLKQQCKAGFFWANSPYRSDPVQSCSAARAKDRFWSNGLTAYAVINLAAIPSPSKKVRTAMRDAIHWLLRHQKKNGSFGDDSRPGGKASYSTTTGIASLALGEVGRCKAAKSAAEWVHRFEVRGHVAGTPLAGERGAIANNKAAFLAGQRHGITKKTRAGWMGATEAGGPALLNLRLSDCRAR